MVRKIIARILEMNTEGGGMMFTGIVEGMATLRSIKNNGDISVG